jgi:hypothetical protein
MHPQQDACTSASADPGACLAVARTRLELRDEAGAREYMEKVIIALNAAPACLRDHAAEGCFTGVVVLLREPPVGLLAQYSVPEGLLELAPRWTGSEATGRRVQARAALQGMCSVPSSDAVARQRACVVLGDLVEYERMKRCGPSCDPTDSAAIAGWSTHDVIDGYAAACKVNKTKVDRARQNAFAEEIARTYKVRGPDASCAVATSELRGASIPDALANMERIRQDVKNRETSTTKAALREAQRISEMEKAQTAAAQAAARGADAEFEKLVLAAIAQSDWATTWAQLTKRRGSPISDTIATSLQGQWQPFMSWAISQSSPMAAYLDLSSRLAKTSASHPIRQSLAALRERALVDARAATRHTRGPGGAWLRAAILARVAGPEAVVEKQAAATAFDKLVSTTRVALTVEGLTPACGPLVKTAPRGRPVKAKSTLVCVLEPERTVPKEDDPSTNVRTFKVVVQGKLEVRHGAAPRSVPIDINVVVADSDGTDGRTFEMVGKAAIETIQRSLVGAIEAEDAAKAFDAARKALKAQRPEAAENHLVIHALLAGSSPELDEILGGFGLTFGELLAP